MNQVPVIVRNPAYVADVEPDEDEVDPANLTPLVSGNAPIVTAPASEDEDVAEDVIEDRDDDEEMDTDRYSGTWLVVSRNSLRR